MDSKRVIQGEMLKKTMGLFHGFAQTLCYDCIYKATPTLGEPTYSLSCGKTSDSFTKKPNPYQLLELLEREANLKREGNSIQNSEKLRKIGQ